MILKKPWLLGGWKPWQSDSHVGDSRRFGNVPWSAPGRPAVWGRGRRPDRRGNWPWPGLSLAVWRIASAEPTKMSKKVGANFANMPNSTPFPNSLKNLKKLGTWFWFAVHRASTAWWSAPSLLNRRSEHWSDRVEEPESSSPENFSLQRSLLKIQRISTVSDLEISKLFSTLEVTFLVDAGWRHRRCLWGSSGWWSW